MEFTITKKVWKVKRSLVIVIPSEIAKMLDIEPGDIVEFKIVKVMKKKTKIFT